MEHLRAIETAGERALPLEGLAGRALGTVDGGLDRLRKSLGEWGLRLRRASSVDLLFRMRKRVAATACDDGGENWERVSKDARICRHGLFLRSERGYLKDADTVYVPTLRCTDRGRGKTFTAIKGAPGGDDYHQLWIDQDNPERMILGCDQGVIVTRNGGETWSSWYNQPTGQFYHVATKNRFPYWVYGAQQHSGAAATASRSNWRALNFNGLAANGSGAERAITPRPIDTSGNYLRRNGGAAGFTKRAGAADPPTLMYPGEYRKTWTVPLVFSDFEPHVLVLRRAGFERPTAEIRGRRSVQT